MLSSNIITSDQKRIKDLFDSLSGSFFLTDKNATIVYANKALEQFTGFSVAESIGKEPSSLWGGHMDRSFYGAMWDALENGESFVGDVHNTKKGGYSEYQRIHIAPVDDSASNTQYYLALNPALHTEEDKIEFKKEFFSVTSYKKDHFVEWVTEKFGSGDRVRLERLRLHEFFRDHLVLPTQELYKNREIDKDLIVAAQARSDAYNELYEKYKKKIFDYFFHRVGEESIASDLTQDTFLRAFKYLNKFVPSNASYLTYLTKIAHNLLVNHYRKIKPSSLDDILHIANEHDLDIDMILDKEKLWKTAEELSDIEQDILSMKYKEEMSVREIALILQKSENAVKLHLSRARNKLRELI